MKNKFITILIIFAAVFFLLGFHESKAQNATTCTSWTYSDWSECTGGQQTRMITSLSPEGCMLIDPLTEQECVGRPAVFFLESGAETVNAGDILEISVNLDRGDYFTNALQFRINYDDSVISPINASMEKSICALWPIEPKFDPGSITASCGKPGILNSGNITTINFEALNSGYADISFDREFSQILDSSTNEPVAFELQDISLEVIGESQIDEKLSRRLSGTILLQVQRNGEAWYIYPDDLRRYYLGRPNDAFDIMRWLGLGATHKFITSYKIYPKRVWGKILLDVEENGEAYYIYPKDGKAYYLGRPADAFSIMRNLGLGITNTDLSKIRTGKVQKK